MSKWGKGSVFADTTLQAHNKLFIYRVAGWKKE